MALDCSVGKGIAMLIHFETLLSKISLWEVMVALPPSDANQIKG